LPLVGSSFCGLAILLGYDRPEGSLWANLSNIDWLGIILFLPSATVVLVALTFGGIIKPWVSFEILLPLILGIVGFGVLAFYERCMARRPMFKASLLHNFSVIGCYLSGAVQGLLLWILLYYMALYYSGIRGESPLATGFLFVPTILAVALVALAVGYLVKKTGDYRAPMLLSWILLTIGFGLLCLLDEHSPKWQMILINILIGMQFGKLAMTIPVAVQASTPKVDHTYAAAMQRVLQSGGQCLGIAIGTATFSNQLKYALRSLGGDERIVAQSLTKIIDALRTKANTYEEGARDMVLMEAVTRSLRAVWVVACIFAALMMVITICTVRNLALIKKNENDSEDGEGNAGRPRRV
jgi:MFS family permease